MSNRLYAQRAVIKYGRHTGAQAMATKWVPGTLTNQITKRFTEPRLIIVADPVNDHQALEEASYMNIPAIALCDTDCSLKNIDVVIPCNNKGVESLASMFYLLAREVKFLRGDLERSEGWTEMIDLFMYRDLAAEKAKEEEEAAAEASDDEEEGEGEEDEDKAKAMQRTGDDDEDDDDDEDEGGNWGAKAKGGDEDSS